MLATRQDENAFPVRGMAMVRLAGFAAVALLCGCQKQPGGQVLAVVNGEEITQQELKAEAEASGAPAGADIQSMTPALLERVVERNLLAGSARDQGLDRGPEYLARRRQLEQALLATLAMRRLVGTPTPPSQSEIDAFIAANPAMFASRQKLTLDQVRFATPSDPKQIKALDALGSTAAIEARLKAQGTRVARGVATLDTGTIEPPAARQITALSNGQLFDLSINGTTYISAITGRDRVAQSPESYRTTAKQLVAQQQTAQRLSSGIATLRKNAKIAYDPAVKPAIKP